MHAYAPLHAQKCVLATDTHAHRFSPSLLKLVMNGEALKEEEIEVVETAADGTITVRKEKVTVTPQEVLRRMLSDSQYASTHTRTHAHMHASTHARTRRYDAVRKILAESDEGLFAEYDP